MTAEPPEEPGAEDVVDDLDDGDGEVFDDGDGDGDGDRGGGEVVHRAIVDAARDGQRADAAVAALVPPLSRAAVQRLIDEGRVALNAQPVRKPGQRVRAGDALEITVPAPAPIELVPEPIPLAILFEDADLIVVDKPAGLVVHPAAGHTRGTLVNALLHHCRDLGGIGGALRPGIVHRLDKDTSGAMVVAKTERAHAALTAAFAARSLAARGEQAPGEPAPGGGGISREYLGIAAPPPPSPSGTLRTFHHRHPVDRKRFSSRVTWGKTAVTHWETAEPLAGAALVRFRLETGRTHQIRVHAADHGWPLLGDPLYGKPPRELRTVAERLGRQALHAAVLELEHPATGRRLRFESPLPADLEAALAALRGGPTRSST
ncbi:MAG TPA: pseudouridine synthase [Kofleriaceae bacterium]|nr:pseudouridine synthase [Kofleriaceae bacterium]